MNPKYNKTYFQERDTLILHFAETIATYARKNKLKTILDVGCGTGKLVKFLRNQKYDCSGCDISTEAVKKARKINPLKSITQAGATSLPYKKNSFDLLISVSVIEHLTKKEAGLFLNEARRILKKGGEIFLVTPNFRSPIRFLKGKDWFGYKDKTHISFYTPNSLIKLLKKHEFEKFQTTFSVKHNPKLDTEFPNFYQKLPTMFKKIVLFLIFNSPASIIRDSFWISAQKK